MSENPPPPPQQPYGQQPPQGYYQQAPAQEKSHTVRNVLIVLGVLFVLFVGGCVAIVGLAANEVDNAIEDIEEGDKRPGGPDNPLEITEGEAFEVYGFDYAAGWSIRKDAIGDVDIKDLKFTNNREDEDGALVEIKFYKGSELLATSDCTSDQVAPGTTVTLTCLSGDDLPKSYDKITINDTF